MTEYEPYGPRHFLRDSAPEGAAELRRHTVPLVDDRTVAKGDAVDTDVIDPGALGYYRTLVVRRSPAQSRPPAAYRLIWRGDYYEAWQRPASGSLLAPRLALGDRVDPYGVPACGQVRALAGAGDLVAADGDPPRVITLRRAEYPSSWSTDGSRDAPVPTGPGTITRRVRDRRPGRLRAVARRLAAPGDGRADRRPPRSATCAASSTIAAGTSRSGPLSSLAAPIGSRSTSAAPTCTPEAPATPGRSGRSR